MPNEETKKPNEEAPKLNEEIKKPEYELQDVMNKVSDDLLGEDTNEYEDCKTCSGMGKVFEGSKLTGEIHSKTACWICNGTGKVKKSQSFGDKIKEDQASISDVVGKVSADLLGENSEQEQEKKNLKEIKEDGELFDKFSDFLEEEEKLKPLTKCIDIEFDFIDGITEVVLYPDSISITNGTMSFKEFDHLYRVVKKIKETE